MEKFKHQVSEPEKMLLPMLITDDGWDETQPSEVLADISEEEPIQDIFNAESCFLEYICQFEDDPLMDTEIDGFDIDNALEDIDWHGYDLPCPRQYQKKQQLSIESYTCLERKAKTQIALAEVSDVIQENLELRCFAEQIYYFDGIIWKVLSDDEKLRCLTGDFLEIQDMLSKRQFVEIFNILRSRRKNLGELKINDEKMQEKINFLNGVYDIRKDIILEHSPEYPFISYLPYEFQPGEIGKGDIFDSYLASISYGNLSVRMRVLQWIAYCISNLPNIKKIALLIGERDSGKTTLARLIAMIVGEENCQAFSFNHTTRFSNDEMFGKKIGLCTDLKGSKLSPESIEWIKNQTGGDIVHAEIKNKRESYSYVSTCKYIIASNFRPDLGEDDALDNRFLTIPFPNSVPDNKKNSNLLNDIKQEMQHVFYLSFQALRSFLDEGMQFADIGELEYYVPKHFTNAEDSVGSFFRECCYLQKGMKTGRREVYECYLAYCKFAEKKAMNDTAFFRCFKKIMGEHNIMDDTNNGRKYNGLVLKDPAAEHSNHSNLDLQ